MLIERFHEYFLTQTNIINGIQYSECHSIFFPIVFTFIVRQTYLIKHLLKTNTIKQSELVIYEIIPQMI